MATKFAPKSDRADIYAEVTAKVISSLEAGITPWVRPWDASGATQITMPVNASTKRPYSGVNVLLLWIAMRDNGFTQNRWLTFNQAKDAGAMVRKGSKGTTVVYASTFIPENERERAASNGDEAKSVAFLKRFTVFNLDQLDNADHLRGTDVQMTEREQHDAAEEIIAATGVEVRVGGDKAFYVPAHDFVQVPHQTAFRDQINYYRTMFHELSHATGHESRLDRKLLNAFGSKDYAREELVAEMGAAFVCASLGIEPTVRHSDYIGNWLTVLREDNRAIFRAASAAAKAADWIMSRQPLAMAA
jgi:antirestriction protein ArdC